MQQISGEHTYQSVISIKLQSNFIEITLRYVCSPVNLLHIFRTPFYKNTSRWLLLKCQDLISTSWHSMLHGKHYLSKILKQPLNQSIPPDLLFPTYNIFNFKTKFELITLGEHCCQNH